MPLAFLAQFSDDKYTYAYLGSKDFTMYPLLPPGTFLQVDESRNRIVYQRLVCSQPRVELSEACFPATLRYENRTSQRKPGEKPAKPLL